MATTSRVWASSLAGALEALTNNQVVLAMLTLAGASVPSSIPSLAEFVAEHGSTTTSLVWSAARLTDFEATLRT